MDPERRERKLADVLLELPLDVRRALLEAIMAPPEERAALIGELHDKSYSREMAELLIDLEEDRLVALEVADALKASLK